MPLKIAAKVDRVDHPIGIKKSAQW
jgi:hypothetical protein